MKKDSSSSKANLPKKLARLPNSYKVEKRPLIRPAIPSPFASASSQKVVYVSHRTPFMSAVRRVQSLLKQVEKRATQSVMAKADSGDRKKHSDKILVAAIADADRSINGRSSEKVMIKGTGKAIEKVLNLAEFFRQNDEFNIELRTDSVWAIDDVVPKTADELEQDEATGKNLGLNMDHADMPEDIPDSRLRQTSMLEVGVTLR